LDDSSPAQLEFSDVTIGILTALEEEYVACREIFDPDRRRGVEKHRLATSGTLTCWLCPVSAKHGGNHVVAIMRLLNMGNTAAAIGANILLQHCDSLKYLIMCGIAGAVPHPTKPEDHVRLGDIVVSDRLGIVQYDFGKQRDPRKVKDDPFAGFEFRPPPRPPCPDLLETVNRVHEDEILLQRDESRAWEKLVDDFLDRQSSSIIWKRPGKAKDRLIDSADGQGDATRHPRDNKRRAQRPRVFRGPIGAANVVLADPCKRDALRDRFGLRAVEMEGFGIADAAWVADVGYLIVRGTCDYCNSCKNDHWHKYAALIAAAYARTVVEYLRPIDLRGLKSTQVVPTAPEIPSPRPSQPAVPTGTSPVLTAPPSGVWQAVEPPQVSASFRNPGTLPLDMGPGSTGVQRLPRPLEFIDQLTVPRAVGGPEERLLRELIDQVKDLSKAGNWPKAEPLAAELERQLRLLPRRGNTVREGWIQLAQVESRRLLATKQAGELIDTARLHSLRQEAESVAD